VPHDAQARELGTGKSRLEVLESLGLKNITLAPLHRLEDGINAVRVFLPKCWFDEKNCQGASTRSSSTARSSTTSSWRYGRARSTTGRRTPPTRSGIWR
jgi:hypothetical protein